MAPSRLLTEIIFWANPPDKMKSILNKQTMFLTEINAFGVIGESHHATGGLGLWREPSRILFSAHPCPYGNIFEMAKPATRPLQTRQTFYPSSFPLSPFPC